MKYTFSATATLICLLVGWNAGVSAQPVTPVNPFLPQLAEFTGGVTAGMESCGIENTGPEKSQQRDQFIQMGGTPEQFEASYQAAYDRVKSEYKSASADERQTMCAELSNLLSAQ